MPLRRGPGKPTVSGNDIDFAMVSDTGAVVRCMITQGAIDNLAGSGASKPIARLRIFFDWQNALEKIASDMYDAGLVHAGGVVVITPRDLIRAGLIP